MDPGATLTRTQLDHLANTLEVVDDPAAVGASLVAAFDGDRLEDPDLGPYVLALAADFLAQSGDLVTALVATERALAVAPDELALHVRHGVYLMGIGMDKEAVADFEPLRSRLGDDPLLAEHVVDALVAGGHRATAEEWLTDALNTLVADSDEADQAAAGATVAALAAMRRDIRRDLELPVDQFDEMAEAFASGLAEVAAGYMWPYWGEEDFGELIRRWPHLVEDWGATWDEHRSILESQLAALADAAGGRSLWIVRADVSELDEIAGPAEDETDGAWVHPYLDWLQNSSDIQSWPPQPEELCWCQSGAVYAHCCLPRRVAIRL